MKPGEQPLMRASAVAALLDVEETQLAKWRRKGTGPPWLRVTSRCIRYPPNDVQAWQSRHVEALAAKPGPPEAVLV